MSRRFSEISHTGIRFWNPLDEDELGRILRELPLSEGAQVLDYGCGNGEVALELASHHNVLVTGIDITEEAIARCRQKLPGAFVAEAFRADRFPPASFDLVINIGASPGLSKLLEEIRPLLRDGARVLIGDAYWQLPPSAEYVVFLGMSESDWLSHDGNLATLRAAGFETERAVVSSLAAWDRYEDRYDSNMLAHLRDHPDDPDFASFAARRSRWRDMYLRHGRGTMGFALYQARRLAETRA